MTTTYELFNQVEELVGTWASPTAMRSALFALHHEATFNMGKDIVPFPFAPQLNDMQMNLTETLARKYEANRGTHMHVGGNTCDENCNNPANNAGDPSLIARKGNCDPFVNFDHSDCTEDECKFDDGAYL